MNSESFNNQLNHSCFLNFNYTKTLNIYYKKNNTGKDIVFMNHIHGELNSNDNLINFGYGDEMDEEYKKIENFNNNEYLIILMIGYGYISKLRIFFVKAY